MRIRRVVPAVLVLLAGSCADTGTAPDGPPQSQAAKGGRAVNYALDFNTSFVNVPDNNLLDLTTTWTLEAWVYPRTAGNGVDQDIVSKWAGNPGASYILQIDATGVIRLVTSNGTDNSIVLGVTALTNNTWQHVAATFDGGTVNLYLNGVLDRTTTGVRTPYVGSEPVAFGREGNFPGGYLNGILDEIRIWNVARTGTEIAASMSRLKGKSSGLVGWWRFNEGEGDVAKDATKNRNHGRLGSAVGADANDPIWVTNVP